MKDEQVLKFMMIYRFMDNVKTYMNCIIEQKDVSDVTDEDSEKVLDYIYNGIEGIKRQK